MQRSEVEREKVEKNRRERSAPKWKKPEEPEPQVEERPEQQQQQQQQQQQKNKERPEDNEEIQEPAARRPRLAAEGQGSSSSSSGAGTSVQAFISQEEFAEVAALHEALTGNEADVAGAYRQPRGNKAVRRMHLQPGFVLDFTVGSDLGEPWDFRRADHRQGARRLQQEQKPWLLVGGPPSRGNSRSPEAKTGACVHDSFCLELYEEQMRMGRLFLHEQPARMRPLDYTGVVRRGRAGRRAEGRGEAGLLGVLEERPNRDPDARRFGPGHMTSHLRARPQVVAVKGHAKWLTNSGDIAASLEKRCPNLGEAASDHRRRVDVRGGSAEARAVYPTALCCAVLHGLLDELRSRGAVPRRGLGVTCDEGGVDTAGGIFSVSNQWGFDTPHAAEEDCQQDLEEFHRGQEFVDDVSGKRLDTEGVKAARKLELEFIDGKPVYKEVPVSECWKVTGRSPIDTKWVDVDKGGPGAHQFRSRWVARQFKDGQPNDDYFSPTPPYEAIRMAISLAASQGRRRGRGERSFRMARREVERQQALEKMREKLGWQNRELDEFTWWCQRGPSEKPLKLELLDISRAHFNGVPAEDTFVELPPERRRDGVCGKLVSNLYGTRGAAVAWEVDYSGNMEKWGFLRGVASPCIFMHSTRRLMVIVHGDDFLCLGTDDDLSWLEGQVKSVYGYKVIGRIGSEPDDDKNLRVLNRMITWTEAGIELEGDQRHAEIVAEMLGLSTAKGVSTPGVKAADEEDQEGEEELGPEDARRFRALVARINFLAQDRPELMYATKESCREMAKPRKSSWGKVKRLGRYLVKRPRAVQVFRHQEMPRSLSVYCDSDWAACKQSRKSTSGGCLIFGEHLLRSWSSTQSVIAMSSGEAEYYALIRGASAGSGMQAMLDDVGLFVPMCLYTDSSAAKGITMRRGLGKTKHVAVAYLWLQHKLSQGKVAIKKVPGEENSADLLTKYLSEGVMEGHRARLGCEYREGRHPGMPTLNPTDQRK